MSLPIPHITTFALLVHMAIGCCWHHGHVCVPTGGANVTVAVGLGLSAEHVQCDAKQTSGQEHCGNETASPNNHDSHEHQCNGSDCVFVRSDESSAEARDVGRGLGLFDSDFVPIAAGSSLIQSVKRTRHFEISASEPLRAHLLLSVLLI